MTIRALPHDAVRAIGAAQAVTSPVIVVKELLDNALDAQASCITIELSSNATDVIQVRDNGLGISPEDRPLLAKQSCTSKIRDHSDLANIGGSSLGFRGEALHSIAQLCRSLTITTRVAGEPIASALTIAKDGESVSQKPVSQAVGTSIRVTDLFSNHNVRKTFVEKQASKNLAAIKSMLMAYAFARPKVRYSLRILRAATAKDGWTYAVKHDATIVQDAERIVGNTCICQCSLQEREYAGYHICAILPKPGADTAALSGVGQFVSVDARPLTTHKGLGSRVCKLYSECMSRIPHASSAARKLFLYIEITCPSSSYDVNVEPSKDDIVLADEQNLMAAVKSVFMQEAHKQCSADAQLPLLDSQAQPLITRETKGNAVRDQTY